MGETIEQRYDRLLAELEEARNHRKKCLARLQERTTELKDIIGGGQGKDPRQVEREAWFFVLCVVLTVVIVLVATILGKK